MAQVKLWLQPLDETLFMERNRQKVLDAMKGLEPEMKLITLLPTEKLQKNFHETIESYLNSKFREKVLSKDEMEYLIVRKLLELTNPNSEYDILFFDKVRGRKIILFFMELRNHPFKELATVYHFESKAMMIESNNDKSLKQLL